MTASVPVYAAASDPRERRREQRGWYFYDWAYSAFNTTVVTVFLGPFLTAIDRGGRRRRRLRPPARHPCPRRGRSSRTSSRSRSLLQVIVLPLVGASPTASSARSELLAVFALRRRARDDGPVLRRRRPLPARRRRCSSSPTSRSARRSSSTTPSCPRSPSPDERDAVSSRGWAFGYLGGGLLLLLNLVLCTCHDVARAQRGPRGPHQPAVGGPLVGAASR